MVVWNVNLIHKKEGDTMTTEERTHILIALEKAIYNLQNGLALQSFEYQVFDNEPEHNDFIRVAQSEHEFNEALKTFSNIMSDFS